MLKSIGTSMEKGWMHSSLYMESFKKLARLCALATALLFPAAMHAEQKDVITFSFWDQATPPFVFLENDELQSGIIKDIGDAIAKKLNREARYIRLPTARVDLHLINGDLDASCVTSPIWKDNPKDFHWSPTLFDGADRFLIRKGDDNKIDSFDDLKGKNVGVYNGYTYHPRIMNMMERGDFHAVKVANIEKGIKLLKLGRIDTIIDFGILLRYQLLSKGLNDELALAEAHADDFSLSCAFSKKSDVAPEEMNAAVSKLIENGELEAVLGKYR